MYALVTQVEAGNIILFHLKRTDSQVTNVILSKISYPSTSIVVHLHQF